jgi:hypothetical protein
VAGTWTLTGDQLTVTWFGARRTPAAALDDEVARLASILGRPLRASIEPGTGSTL